MVTFMSTLSVATLAQGMADPSTAPLSSGGKAATLEGEIVAALSAQLAVDGNETQSQSSPAAAE